MLLICTCGAQMTSPVHRLCKSLDVKVLDLLLSIYWLIVTLISFSCVHNKKTFQTYFNHCSQQCLQVTMAKICVLHATWLLTLIMPFQQCSENMLGFIFRWKEQRRWCSRQRVETFLLAALHFVHWKHYNCAKLVTLLLLCREKKTTTVPWF